MIKLPANLKFNDGKTQPKADQSCQRHILLQGAWLDAKGIQNAEPRDYKESLSAMKSSWQDFVRQLHRKGWDVEKQVYKLGQARLRKKRKHA